MILIIGGYAQGQLEYVRQRYEVTDRQVFSACLPVVPCDQKESQGTPAEQPIVIQDFNAWLRQEIMAIQNHDGVDSETEMVRHSSEKDSEIESEVVVMENAAEKDSETLIFEQLQRKLEEWLAQYPNALLISDEVGNGLVPMAKEERLIRDLIGRTQVYLAKRAEEVIRVICGIGQRIQ